MIFWYPKRRKLPGWNSLFVAFICLSVIFNEFLSYKLNSFHWPAINCGGSTNVFKILLIADPQILGEDTESTFAIWDSDRYLSKTFHEAVRHVNPNLIIFLGDLMDEGSTATDSQFDRYYQRFQRIFALNIYKNKSLYIPGDNDIGGEKDDVVTAEKVTRFKNHFNQPDVYQNGDISVYKINHMTRSYPAVLSNDTAKVRIAVSHIPILDVPTRFMQRAVSKIHPHIIFSAHDHESIHFLGNQQTGERYLLEEMDANDFTVPTTSAWRFQISPDLTNEMVVPTCSYRMGTQDIGYSIALIDIKEGAVCYDILWLPRRLMQLVFYLYVIVPLVSLFTLLHVCNFLNRKYCRLPL